MKHLGFPQLCGGSVVSGTRGDMEGARTSVSYAGCICQRDTWRRGPRGGIQDVTRCPLHGEGSLDPALLSLRIRRRLRCPGPCLPHAWKALPLPEAEETRLPKPTPDPRVPLWSPRATPGAVGRGPPARAVLRVRQSAEQEAARAASLPPGRRGNGLAGGGAEARRLLFLPLPVPCGHVAMATEFLSPAASRLGWRA